MRQEDQERLAILDWLTPVDYGYQQSDFLNRRQEGTGEWLVRSHQYLGWLTAKGQTLFCPGIPGAGKTILTATVIDDITTRFCTDPNIGVAYLYCNFQRKDKQQVHDLLASLVKQLSLPATSQLEAVKGIYYQHTRSRTRPSVTEVSQLLKSVAMQYSTVYIIVDGLDECQVENGCRSSLISELFGIQESCASNLFATSRFIPEITEEFEGRTTLEIMASEQDVRRYVDGHISNLPPFVRRDLSLQEEITASIVQAVKGM